MISRRIKTLILFWSSFFLLLEVGSVQAADPAELALKAQNALAADDHVTVVRVMLELLELDNKENFLDSEKRDVCREWLMLSAASAFYNGKDCRFLTEMIAEIEPYRPTVKEANANPQFQRWPLALLFLSECHLEQLHDAETARVYYGRFLEFSDINWEDKEVFKNLKRMAAEKFAPDRARTDRYAVGTYVTNASVFQQWIGRVVEKKKNAVVVRLTYGDGDSKWFNKVGDNVTFTLDEIMLLESLSIKAAIAGWR